MAAQVQALLEIGHQATRLLAERVRAQLAQGEDPTAWAALESELDRLCASQHLSLAYVLDGDGVCRATSNRHRPDSLHGKAFPDRRYFRDALSPAREGHQWALGRVTGTRGFYHGLRVEGIPSTLVAVIKQDITLVDQLFANRKLLLLVGEDGQVFASSGGPALIGRHLHGPGGVLEHGRPLFEVAPPREGWRILGLRLDGEADWDRLLALAVLALGGLITCVQYAALASREEARQLQQAARETVEGVLERSAGGILTLAPDRLDPGLLRVDQANAQASLLLGLEDGRLHGSRLEELPALGLDRPLAAIRGAVAGGPGVSLDQAFDRAGGSRWLRISAARFRSGAVVTINDLTDLRRAEQELRNARDLLQRVLDACPAAVLLFDAGGQVLMANRTAGQVFDRDPGWLIGRRRAEFMADPQAAGSGDREDRLVLESGRELATEDALPGTGGGPRFFRTLRVATTGPDGLPAVLVLASEVTDLRQALEHSEADRARAEGLQQATQDFLATLSHEIRAPLGGLAQLAQLIADSSLPPQQQEQAQALHRGVDGVLSLLNDILDHARLESGRLELEAIPFDLRTVLHEAAELLRPRLLGRPVELVVDIPASLPCRVLGDPVRLRQVVVNLLANAIKFTERGQVLLELRAGGEATAGRRGYLLAVEDSGIGIEPERQAGLFRPWRQADASIARRYGGSGLGLAICKRLIEGMGGAIGVQSRPGQGSRFTCQVAWPLDAVGTPPEGQGLPAGLRILICDPHPRARAALANALRGAGGVVAESGSPGEAVALLEEARSGGAPVALALLGRGLPSLDGEELGRLLRRETGFAATALLLLTGTADPGPVGDLAAEGFDGYLEKPVHPELLVGVARAALERRRAGGTGPLATRPALEPGPACAGARVLLAEDDPLVRRMLVLQLEKLGCSVVSAEDGEQALVRLAQERFAVVLMDCQMPVCDGFTAVERLRRREVEQGLPRTPVLALTGRVEPGDRERCLAAGFDEHLAKPVTERTLARAVARWRGAV